MLVFGQSLQTPGSGKLQHTCLSRVRTVNKLWGREVRDAVAERVTQSERNLSTREGQRQEELGEDALR